MRSVADIIERKDTLPVNRYEGFKANGAIEGDEELLRLDLCRRQRHRLRGIQYRVPALPRRQRGKDIENHPLLDLLDGSNDTMTGIDLKYVTTALLLAPLVYIDGIASLTDNSLNPATATT